MATEKTKKNEKNYNCLFCHFTTSKKTDYDRHNSTQKHTSNILATLSNTKNDKKYTCEICSKEYINRVGLWRHKKSCKKEVIDDIYVSPDKELIMMLVKQNSELLEVIKNGTHNTHKSHNTNSLNKTFNLQFFLNETCKDAMNIMDFVDSIQLQVSDLEKVGQIGYVEGISNIITSNLKALDVTQRPVHCTDKKREILYIKDENTWTKEDEDKQKIRKVIKRVATKNQRLIQKFKELHPDYGKASSNISDQYNKIIVESMGGSGDNDLEKEDKIIKKITYATIIDKEL